MAEIVFSRVGGFKFNGLTVDNSADDEIYLLEVVRSASPTLTRFDFIVPKRHGSKSFDNRYEDKYIDVVVGIYAKTVQLRRQMQRALLQQIIGIEGRLSFNDDPLLFYTAKNYDEVQVEEEEVYTKLTIPFKCSPFMYELYDDLRDYTVNELTMAVDDMGMLVNRATWDGITTGQIRQIENTGNFQSQPIIELSGSASLVTVQILDKSFSFNNLANETVFINCEEMIAYKIVGSAKASVLPRFSGLFPLIPVGLHDVTIGGSNLNLSITVDFKNTYRC